MKSIQNYWKINGFALKVWRHFCSDSLFRNSIYIMLATAVMSGFGFFFWLISARLVSTENIGIATTLISTMNMIAIFSLIGFDSAIIRFLSHSTQRNAKLNTAIILVGIVAIILGTFFVVFIQNISPRLSFIRDNFFVSFSFILFCAISAVNLLTDSIFVAYRQTKFSLIINTIFSFFKMLLPFAFVSWSSYGIFSAAAIGQTIGFILSISALIWKFDYRPQLAINRDVIRQVWKYCIGNYVAGTLNLLPITLLPIIITNNLGPKEAAFFYIVIMIGNLLYVIPQAAAKSLFSESSHDEKTLGENIKKAIRIINFFLIPAIILLILTGKHILDFFGKSYSSGGVEFLNLVAISGIAVSAYSISVSLFRIYNKLRLFIATNTIYCVTIIFFSYVFLPLGLIGIGYAWILGNVLAGSIGIIYFYRTRHGQSA